MSDLTDFLALLARWEVPHKQQNDIVDLVGISNLEVTQVGIPTTESDPFSFTSELTVGGYAGFYGVFYFTREGQFLNVSFWE